MLSGKKGIWKNKSEIKRINSTEVKLQEKKAEKEAEETKQETKKEAEKKADKKAEKKAEKANQEAEKRTERKRYRMEKRKTGWNKKSWIENLGVVILLGCLLNFAAVSAHQTILQQGIAESVLRFHVLANSDSTEDQAVKLEVRDAVLTWINEKMMAQAEEDAVGQVKEQAKEQKKDQTKQQMLVQSEAYTMEFTGEQGGKTATCELANDNKAKMEAFLQENIENIVAVADQVLEEYGMPYRASAKIEQCYFPDRTYGDCTFPSGWYDALRICLGEAEGHNWWCVLYPRLCFADCLHAVTEETEYATESVMMQEGVESIENRMTVQDETSSMENRMTAQNGTESAANRTIVPDEMECEVSGTTAQDGTESEANGMNAQSEAVSVDEEQLQELEAVLTVEEYECLLQSPGQWKIGWRWLKFW